MIKKLVNGEVKDLAGFNVGNVRVYSSKPTEKSCDPSESFNQVTPENEKNSGQILNGMNLFR